MKNTFTILCVDDEPDILNSLQRVLGREGYRVLTALNGEEALEILEKEGADAVISDQRMPKMLGYEFLKKVRDKYPDCIRMMLSGYSDFESLVQSVNEGEIVRFISKPWNNNELIETVRLVLDQGQILSRVRQLLQNIHGLAELAGGLSIETGQEGNSVSIKISSKEKLKNDEDIYHLLEFLLQIINEYSEQDMGVLTRSITKENNQMLFDIELGKGVKLKIIIPGIQPNAE